MLACGVGLLLLGPLLTPRMALDISLLAGLQARLQPITERLGETINPNILAGGIALLTPLAAALALRWDWTPHRWLPILLGLLSCCGVGMIVLAQSRGADIGAILAILIIFALRWPKLTYATPLLLLLLIVSLYWLGPNFLFPKLTNDSALGGLEGRLEIWSRAFYAIQDFPFTGIGIGTFGEVIPLLYPYFIIAPDVSVPHAHNLLLQIAIDLGLPGLIAYLALLINLFRMVYTILANRQSALVWALGAGSLGALIAMLLHGMVDATLWGSKLALLPWLLFAMITRLYLAQFATPLATASVMK
jgi:putative inorganic carbon (HCO3(-)) transporter